MNSMNIKPILFIVAICVIATMTITYNNVNIAKAENIQNTSDNAIPLKQAKLIIEHNTKDKDTGFQGFVDSEGWNRISLSGPNGILLDFQAKGSLGKLGLTELFFETVEPENANFPIGEILETLPEGSYTFSGFGIESGEKTGKIIGTANLTHNIPQGPTLLTPVEGDKVPVDDLLVSWSPVNENIDGSDINIISYQLIIEKDEDPHQNIIGKRGLSMYLPSDVTQITIPAEFFESGTDYDWEVLAIEESGNQSLMSSHFSTEE